jgi:hypothetical protein
MDSAALWTQPLSAPSRSLVSAALWSQPLSGRNRSLESAALDSAAPWMQSPPLSSQAPLHHSISHRVHRSPSRLHRLEPYSCPPIIAYITRSTQLQAPGTIQPSPHYQPKKWTQPLDGFSRSLDSAVLWTQPVPPSLDSAALWTQPLSGLSRSSRSLDAAALWTQPLSELSRFLDSAALLTQQLSGLSRSLDSAAL